MFVTNTFILLTSTNINEEAEYLTSDKIAMLSLLIAFIGLIYTVYTNNKTNKINAKVKRVQLDVLKASELYGQIKCARRLYESSLASLITEVSSEEQDINKIQKNLIETNNLYTEFFNEINNYCILVNAKAIDAENYIKDIINPDFKKFAKIQYETFSTLQTIAKIYSLPRLIRPDRKAFKEYDDFLQNYNGGEDSNFWQDLKQKRIDNGLKLK